MKGLQLTTEEKQLILEALLFTSHVDVCSDHNSAHRRRMVDLALKINDVNQKLHNIYIYESNCNDDEIPAEEMIKTFPNLPVHTAITD
jgi:hypothetical protein